MTQYPATHSTSKPGSSSASGGIDLKTLFITAVSSAAAAYATSKVWTPGTLAAAAFTPVLVAVIREALAKSTDAVTKVVPVKGVVRSARPEGPAAPAADPASGDWSAADLIASQAPPPSPPPSVSALPGGDPAARVAQPGEIAYHHSSRSTRARNWRVAIVTGLLGFLVAAVAFTVPELVAGSSASGGGRDTTIFGGGHHSSTTPAVTTTTETTPTETAPTETVPPVTQPPAVTVPPQTVTTPEPSTAAPQQTTPAPATTAPTPPPVAEPPPAGVPPG